MQIEQIQALADDNVQDINNYTMAMDNFHAGINLEFEMQVDMPYQYWIDIHKFYAFHEQSLSAVYGDVIKRVMKLYGELIIGFLADSKPFSPQRVHEMLADYEGLYSEPFITVKIHNFDFDVFDDMTIDYEVN